MSPSLRSRFLSTPGIIFLPPSHPVISSYFCGQGIPFLDPLGPGGSVLFQFSFPQSLTQCKWSYIAVSTELVGGWGVEIGTEKANNWMIEF